jgi:predicted AAA+ superfamily ATPase
MTPISSFVQAAHRSGEAHSQCHRLGIVARIRSRSWQPAAASRALRALEKTFGRIQALWKPVATEEAFEIVRRRLFEPVRDGKTRDAVCRAFADAYVAEGSKLPAETQEGRYYDRLVQAYPIHTEVFDRLYEDWTTIDGFQRTTRRAEVDGQGDLPTAGRMTTKT